MTEDEMVGWHHRLNGHGFGWTLGFKLFYHCDLSEADFDELVANSIGTQEALAPAA